MTAFTDTLRKKLTAKEDVYDFVKNSGESPDDVLTVASTIVSDKGSRDDKARESVYTALRAIAEFEDLDINATVARIHKEFALGNQFLEEFLKRLGETLTDPDKIVSTRLFVAENGYGEYEAVLFQLAVMNSGNISITLLDKFMQNGIMKKEDSFWNVCWDKHMDNLRAVFFNNWLEENPDMKLIPRDFAERMWMGWLPDSIKETIPAGFGEE